MHQPLSFIFYLNREPRLPNKAISCIFCCLVIFEIQKYKYIFARWYSYLHSIPAHLVLFEIWSIDKSRIDSRRFDICIVSTLISGYFIHRMIFSLLNNIGKYTLVNFFFLHYNCPINLPIQITYFWSSYWQQ